MEYKPILHRVGMVLLALGLLDIGIMVYCIAHSVNYSSSYNIFAVIAGIFLLRGSTKAAGIVVQFAAFLLAVPLILIVFPLFYPLDLLALQLRLHPVVAIIATIDVALFVGATYWTFKQLRRPEVVLAVEAAGHSRGNPRWGFLAGSAIAIGLPIALHFAMNGETAQEAISRARQQAGSGFKYHVESFQSSWAEGEGTHYMAVVSAYNSSEIKSITLEWKK